MRQFFYTTISAFILCIFSSAAMAQATLDTMHLVSKGKRTVFYHAGSDGVTPGLDGPNMTWDYSGLATDTTDSLVTYYVDTAKAIYNPAATIAGRSLRDTAKGYTFLKRSNDSLFYYGAVAPMFGPTTSMDTLSYDDPQLIMKVPFAYGDEYTDSFKGRHGFYPGRDWIIKGSLYVKADGYGSLMLPKRTYTDVLRVYTLQQVSDTNVRYGNHLLELVETYTYYQDKTFHPLMIVQSLSNNRNGQWFDGGTTVWYNDRVPKLKSSGIAPQATAEDDFRLYPNPSREGAPLKLQVPATQSGQVQVNVLNLLGQLQKTYWLPSAPGDNTLSLDVQPLPKGVYMVQILGDHEKTVQRLVIE